MTFCTLVLIWVCGLSALALWQQKVTGDLTRVGRWSERDFGFRRTHPAVATVANQAGDASPDVAVLGDSFSNTKIWQSVVSRSTGQQFKSWRFVEGKTCIKDWLDGVLHQYPKVKVVVFETIERAALNRAVHSYDCAGNETRFIASGAGEYADERSFWPLTLSPEYAVHTLVNSIQQGRRPDKELRSEVVNVPLTQRGLFSSRRDDRLLYYTDDEAEWRASPEIFATALNNLSALDRDLKERHIQFVFVMVPDKSHVYRDLMLTSHLRGIKTDFPEALQKAGLNAPDLLARFKTQALTVEDFYLPDDTHLSARGFEFLGSTLAAAWPSIDGTSR